MVSGQIIKRIKTIEMIYWHVRNLLNIIYRSHINGNTQQAIAICIPCQVVSQTPAVFAKVESIDLFAV